MLDLIEALSLRHVLKSDPGELNRAMQREIVQTECFNTVNLTTREEKENCYELNNMPVERRTVPGDPIVVCDYYDFPFQPIQLQ